MDCTLTDLSYSDTGYFSTIVQAYIGRDKKLRPFYKHPASIEGIAAALKEKLVAASDRKLLVDELTSQYNILTPGTKVADNISLLAKENTFTVCTAHQPAIFGGTLFFIYKIVHAIRLAEYLGEVFPENNFVPVFYMGSEDADLDELGHIFLDGEKIVWNTKQTGAIGRMNTEGLEQIIERIEGEFSVFPFGNALVQLLQDCYLNSPDIQTATFKLTHELFKDFGLVVLIPDTANLKRRMLPFFEDELFNQTSQKVVGDTVAEFARNFTVQAHPRGINLFYLKGNIRERIERNEDEWRVVNTNIVFDRTALEKELQAHPERFSPNVILRGIFQETILPDVAFIGGGGELAYWMELKNLFEHYRTPYPVLVLRNSFLVIEERWKAKLDKLRIPVAGIFRDEAVLFKELVQRESSKQLGLDNEIDQLIACYDSIQAAAEKADHTLAGHVAALKEKSVKSLYELEKKMLRAEKKRFEVEEKQLKLVKQALFPNNGLQERVDNILPFYAKWGKEFIKMIYNNSGELQHKFRIIEIK